VRSPASRSMRLKGAKQMNRDTNEDAGMSHAHRSPSGSPCGSETPEQLVQRWRDLREMLIRQLDMFETGGLTLHANNRNISGAAIADLKHSILEFDAMISGGR
jgi:hypothetical protein